MKTIRAILTGQSYRIIRLGIGLSILFLIADMMMDVYYFREGNILAQILAPSPYEIYMRFSVVVLVLVFSTYVQAMTWRLQTNQRKLERELAEHGRADEATVLAEANYRAMVENATVGIFQSTPGGRLLSVNPALARIYGYDSPAEMLASVADIARQLYVDPASRQEFQRQLAERGQVAEYVVENYRRDGRRIWAVINARTVKDKESHVLYLEGFIVDITARKHAEETYRISEEKYRDLVENIPDVIFTVDAKGILTYISPVHERLSGYKAAELIGSLFADFVHPDDLPQFAANYALVIDGQAVPSEYRIRTKHGEYVWVRSSSKRIVVDGQLVGIQGVLTDITEHKQADNALRVSEEKFRSFIEQSSEGMVLVDEHGDISEWNHAEEQITGIPRAEAIGAPFGDIQFKILPPERRAGRSPEFFRKALEVAFQTGQVPPLAGTNEIAIQTVAGEPKSILQAAFPIKTEGGYRIGALIRDITERKQAEAALRASETKFREMAEQLVDVLFVSDSNGIITYGSPSTARVFGLDPAEMIGRNFVEFLANAEMARATEQFQATIEGGLPSQRLELVMKRRDGSTFPAELNASVFYGDGRVTGTMGLIRDVSERKQADERIQVQLRRLAALRAIDDAIIGSFDNALALSEILQQTATQLNTDAACILLLNRPLQRLTYAAGRGFRSDALKHTDLRLGEGYAGQAVLERRTINVPDLRVEKTSFLRSPHFSTEGFVAYFAVPLIAKGQMEGVLEIFHRSFISPDPEWLNFLETLAKQAAIAVDNAQLFVGMQRANADLFRAYDDTIEGWSRALDLRDKETEGHTERVTEMTVRLARAMDMSGAEISHLRRGALLHDIGKMGVPDAILNKPSTLTDDEWKTMRLHPQLAHDVLAPIAYLRPALDIPYCHHEKWDGSGYPRGMKGEAIPLAARIFAVVDVWDALCSDRPYRARWPEEKVLEHIRSLAGTHFDPKAVDLFLSVVSEKTQGH